MSIVTSFSLYHCTLCNRFHFDDQETYKEHLGHVDDHGIVTRQRVNNKLLKIVGGLATTFIVVFFGWVGLRAIHFWPHVPKLDEPPAVTTIFCLSIFWQIFVGYGPLTYGADPWGRNWKEWLRDQMPGVIGLVWFCVVIGAFTQMPAPLFSGPTQAPFAKFFVCFVLLDLGIIYSILHFDPSAKAIAKANARRDRAAQALVTKAAESKADGFKVILTPTIYSGLASICGSSKELHGMYRHGETKSSLWFAPDRVETIDPVEALNLCGDVDQLIRYEGDVTRSPAAKAIRSFKATLDQAMDENLPGWRTLREKFAAVAVKGNAVSPTDNIEVGNCVGMSFGLWFALTLKFRIDGSVWDEASAYGLKIVLALVALSALLFGIFGVLKIIRFILLRILVLLVRVWRAAERVADDEEHRRSRAK